MAFLGSLGQVSSKGFITSTASKGVSTLISSLGVSIPILGVMIGAVIGAVSSILGGGYNEEEDYTEGIQNFAALTKQFSEGVAEDWRGIFLYYLSDPEWVLYQYGSAISEWVPTVQKLLPNISKGITAALEASRIGPITDALFDKLSPYLSVLEYLAVMFHVANGGLLQFESYYWAPQEGPATMTQLKQYWSGWENDLGKPAQIMENVRNYLEQNGIDYPRPSEIANNLQSIWKSVARRFGLDITFPPMYPPTPQGFEAIGVTPLPTLVQYLIQLKEQAVTQPVAVQLTEPPTTLISTPWTEPPTTLISTPWTEPPTTLISTPWTEPPTKKMTDTQFITSLYQNILKREPDPQGLAEWIEDYVASGRNQTWTLQAFIAAAQGAGETIYSTTLPTTLQAGILSGIPTWAMIAGGGLLLMGFLKKKGG